MVVAGVARRYALCSDSSQRFERGVDPSLPTRALERATELLLSIVGGKVGPITAITESTAMPKNISVLFNPIKVKQLTGLDIPVANMADMLTGLGMTVEQTANAWTVAIPSHRFDIALDVDLVEEIVRLYGYDNIIAAPVITSVQAGAINPSERMAFRISRFLSGRGYHETISYSFVDPMFQQAIYPDAQAMQLLNPISSELSQMRVGMWPGLLASMVYNMHRQQTSIKFFEAGVVFDVDGETLHERPCIAGLITGEHGSMNWSESARMLDFYDMKGDLQALFADLQLQEVRFIADNHPALHPGQSARILIGDKPAGWVGALHPGLLEELGLSAEVILFELSLAPLNNDKPIRYQPISKYPQIRRDLSLLVNKSVTAGQIELAVREVVEPGLLKSLDIFDVYTGESIPADKKSLAMALTLQDEKRTLIDAEITAVIDTILKKLDVDLAIVLRDAANGQ